MARFNENPFAEEANVNPFANTGGAARGSTIDIPLDSAKDLKKKEKELQAREADLRRREQEVKRREEALAGAGVVVEERNWPPFCPIIHHDIANEIPIHLQRMQYVAFTTLLGMFDLKPAVTSFCLPSDLQMLLMLLSSHITNFLASQQPLILPGLQTD
uniref:Secretory carrier-associated membrane protein n=1 Tax=Nicotiana tabacum TaxID=4097 RepID=A0A1S4DD10_TOBAC